MNGGTKPNRRTCDETGNKQDRRVTGKHIHMTVFHESLFREDAAKTCGKRTRKCKRETPNDAHRGGPASPLTRTNRRRTNGGGSTKVKGRTHVLPHRRNEAGCAAQRHRPQAPKRRTHSQAATGASVTQLCMDPHIQMKRPLNVYTIKLDTCGRDRCATFLRRADKQNSLCPSARNRRPAVRASAKMNQQR